MSGGSLNFSWETLEQVGAPIWENIYKVRIPQSETYDASTLKHFGRPSTGDKRLDAEHLNEMCEVYLTINDIVEHYRVGTKLIFANNADVQDIYTVVNRYLQMWAQLFSNGLNVAAAPTEDLLLLDRFASEIQQQSMVFNSVAPKAAFGAIGVILQKLGATVGLTRAGRDMTGLNQEAHVSMGELFTQAVTRRNQSLNGGGDSSDPMNRWK